MEVPRIHKDAALYYLTFSVIHWLPVFVREEPCLIVTESLNFCDRSKGLHI
jgi:putative transposase